MTWTDPDVVAVGVVRDAEGRPVVEHRRGWLRIVVGVALCVAAIGAVVVGAVGFAVGQGALVDGAVAEGRVQGPGDNGGAASGTLAEAGPVTVLILTPGRFENETTLEREVAAIECVADLADGTTATIRGSRQGLSTVTDGSRSVGVFDAPAGAVTVRCALLPQRSVGLAGERAFVVAPGQAEVVDSLLIGFAVSGGLGLVGGLVLWWGVRGRVDRRA